MIRPILMMLSLVMLVACGSGAPPPTPTQAQIDVLAANIMALSSDIDPVEARQAAQIAYEYPLVLRMQYNVTDPPLIHNAKVNRGQRPRGLCFHWADDMEAEFKRQGFQTLVTHRAIANDDSILIDHSTVILGARGSGMQEGIITDPWRYGGELFWARVPDDTRYTWVERERVWELRSKRRARWGVDDQYRPPPARS